MRWILRCLKLRKGNCTKSLPKHWSFQGYKDGPLETLFPVRKVSLPKMNLWLWSWLVPVRAFVSWLPGDQQLRPWEDHRAGAQSSSREAGRRPRCGQTGSIHMQWYWIQRNKALEQCWFSKPFSFLLVPNLEKRNRGRQRSTLLPQA